MTILRQIPTKLASRIVIADAVWNGLPCWQWTGTIRSHDGRPIYHNEYVYRLMYEALREPLPRGKGNASHHLCENKWCVNPFHVAAISQSDHMRQHELGGDWGQALKTRCPAGHLYDEANTYWWRSERRCRTCSRENMRRYRARGQQ